MVQERDAETYFRENVGGHQVVEGDVFRDYSQTALTNLAVLRSTDMQHAEDWMSVWRLPPAWRVFLAASKKQNC